MQPRITARHFTITDELREYIRDKLSKLERYYNGITDVHVIVAVERGHTIENKSAEVILTVYRQTLSARESGESHEAAIDSCMEGLRRQLLRYKAKLRDTAKNVHR